MLLKLDRFRRIWGETILSLWNHHLYRLKDFNFGKGLFFQKSHLAALAVELDRPPLKASIDLELNREHEYLLVPPRTTKQPETSEFSAYEQPNIENKHKDQQKKQEIHWNQQDINTLDIQIHPEIWCFRYVLRVQIPKLGFVWMSKDDVLQWISQVCKNSVILELFGQRE